MEVKKNIVELFAYISREEGKEDELMGIAPPGLDKWIPFVGADMERMNYYKKLALMSAKIHKQEVHLLKFKLVSDEVIFEEEDAKKE